MIPQLVELCRELMAASKYRQPFNADYVSGLAHRVVRMPSYLVLTAWQAGETAPLLVGFIAGSVGPMLFAPDLVAVEETVYVRPDTAKRASVANQLMDGLKAWAFKDKGAAFIRGGETSGMEPRAVDFFFRRNGYKRSGTIYELHKEDVA